MILDFNILKDKYSFNIKGIIHIGGHYGQEYDLYKNLNVPVLFFEPLSNNFEHLQNKVKNDPNIIMYQCALGNENKIVTMNVDIANQGQSSSILKPKKHLEQYPHITFDYTEEVNMFRLDDIDVDLSKYNFINIDVQGYEMEVLKGANKTLENIDYIISEVNRDEVYENCPHVDDLDLYLNHFDRVETDWAGDTWGDALYIKKKLKIYPNFTHNYNEDPARYYGFEKHKHLAPYTELFFGASQNPIITQPSNNKKILFATEEQIHNTDPNYEVGDVNLYVDYVDEILSISPLCERKPKRKYVFQPFDDDFEPINKNKIWDIIYTGYSVLSHVDHIINTIKHFNYRFVSFNRGNNLNTTYAEKLQLIANSKINVVHNVISEDIPQLKTRPFEAAFCKSLILCRYDKFKTLEKWFTPGEDFIYYEDNNLKDTIEEILNNYDNYIFMIENAYNKAKKEYTTKRFIEKYLI